MKSMQNITLVATDLDGTLLRSDHTVSEYTQAVWKKLLEKNMHVIPCTGRPFGAMHTMIPSHLCEYLICTNGVHIYKSDPASDVKFTLVRDESMDWDLALQVIDAKEAFNPKIHMHCYIGNSLYSKHMTPELQEYIERTNMHVGLIKEWDELAGSKVSKIMCVSDNAHLKTLQAHLQQRLRGVTVTFSSPYYLEIFSEASSKLNALEYVMNLLGTDKNHALAVGDSYNDLSMLEHCAKAYVMKNALPELAPNLPRTRYTNDEDGVAKLCEELFL